MVYYVVYLCGDELPTAMFADLESADRFCSGFTQRWMDKEIRTVDFWTISPFLFRDLTKHLRYVSSKKDNERTNQADSNS